MQNNHMVSLLRTKNLKKKTKMFKSINLHHDGTLTDTTTTGKSGLRYNEGIFHIPKRSRTRTIPSVAYPRHCIYIYIYMLYSHHHDQLYKHIYICMQNHNDDTIKTSDTVLRKVYLSLYLKGLCVRGSGDRTELEATPHKAPTIQPPASHHENYPS